jgi:hypothetical protein
MSFIANFYHGKPQSGSGFTKMPWSESGLIYFRSESQNKQHIAYRRVINASTLGPNQVTSTKARNNA